MALGPVVSLVFYTFQQTRPAANTAKFKIIGEALVLGACRIWEVSTWLWQACRVLTATCLHGYIRVIVRSALFQTRRILYLLYSSPEPASLCAVWRCFKRTPPSPLTRRRSRHRHQLLVFYTFQQTRQAANTKKCKIIQKALVTGPCRKLKIFNFLHGPGTSGFLCILHFSANSASCEHEKVQNHSKSTGYRAL